MQIYPHICVHLLDQYLSMPAELSRKRRKLPLEVGPGSFVSFLYIDIEYLRFPFVVQTYAGFSEG